jgi:predicted nucleotide-binding protein
MRSDEGIIEQKEFPKLRIPRQEAEKWLREQVSKGDQLRERPDGNRRALEALYRDFVVWSEFNELLLRHMFVSSQYADEYAYLVALPGGDRSLAEQWEEYRDEVAGRVRRLRSALRCLAPLRSAGLGASVKPRRRLPLVAAKERVFVVHGHDEATRERVAHFLRRLGLESIVLCEEPNSGLTLIEKVEANADVAFAVILLTGDDSGALASNQSNLRPRARQNVILELGFFMGRLGRSHMAALYEDGVELPSDIQGVLYVPLTKDGSWQLGLAKELKKAGLDVDVNKLA